MASNTVVQRVAVLEGTNDFLLIFLGSKFSLDPYIIHGIMQICWAVEPCLTVDGVKCCYIAVSHDLVFYFATNATNLFGCCLCNFKHMMQQHDISSRKSHGQKDVKGAVISNDVCH